jgi:hypothetical protein
LSGGESAPQQKFEPRVCSLEEIEMDGHGLTIVRTRANPNLAVKMAMGIRRKQAKMGG